MAGGEEETTIGEFEVAIRLPLSTIKIEPMRRNRKVGVILSFLIGFNPLVFYVNHFAFYLSLYRWKLHEGAKAYEGLSNN